VTKVEICWVPVTHACNLATQEAEIRSTVQSQSGQIVLETLSQKTLSHTHKNWAGGLAQGEGPEFKPQYQKKKAKIIKIIPWLVL
jgi:hypothetical protein